VCGDINEDTVIGSAAGLFAREDTHPWSTTCYDSTLVVG